MAQIARGLKLCEFCFKKIQMKKISHSSRLILSFSFVLIGIFYLSFTICLGFLFFLFSTFFAMISHVMIQNSQILSFLVLLLHQRLDSVVRITMSIICLFDIIEIINVTASQVCCNQKAFIVYFLPSFNEKMQNMKKKKYQTVNSTRRLTFHD